MSTAEKAGAIAAKLLLCAVGLLYLPLRWRPVGTVPVGGILWFPKLLVGALSHFVAGLGLVISLFGAVRRSRVIALPAGLATLAAAIAVRRVGAPSTELDRAFGPDWPRRIPEIRRARMLDRRWRGRLPGVPEPRVQRDVGFGVRAEYRARTLLEGTIRSGATNRPDQVTPRERIRGGRRWATSAVGPFGA